jgi:hypothetical protein
MMPDQLQKWLRQQSKDIYAAGKAMGQVYQYWWRICREINVFSSRFEYHMFCVLYPIVTYLLTFPRIFIKQQNCLLFFRSQGVKQSTLHPLPYVARSVNRTHSTVTRFSCTCPGDSIFLRNKFEYHVTYANYSAVL